MPGRRFPRHPGGYRRTYSHGSWRGEGWWQARGWALLGPSDGALLPYAIEQSFFPRAPRRTWLTFWQPRKTEPVVEHYVPSWLYAAARGCHGGDLGFLSNEEWLQREVLEQFIPELVAEVWGAFWRGETQGDPLRFALDARARVMEEVRVAEESAAFLGSPGSLAIAARVIARETAPAW